MIVIAHRAPVFATNTLVLAADRGGSAVVVDPGAGTATQVRRTLREHDLTLAAIVLTHGHPDHLWDCTALGSDVPVHIGADDADRLADPLAHLGADLGAAFTQVTGDSWQAPQTVHVAHEGTTVDLPGGVSLTAVAAPGHTPGSTLWSLAGPAELTGPAFAEVGLTGHDGPVWLTGDVLFAGSIGRCDLPGGDETRMAATLQRLTGLLPSGALLVPGHGPATTMAHELATNPFLVGAQRR